MKWALQVGVFAGIKVYVHATFVILLAWVGAAHWRADQSATAVLAGLGFILALFACVLLHEFGHALTARRFGIRTRDITMLPIGGVARLERMPREPRQELLVAVAGPAVNLVIAALLYVVLRVTGTMDPIDGLTMTRGAFLERLMVINVMLVVFNMIPAFPMDGGRVLRALLATRMDYARATRAAAALGQAVALAFGLLGLFGNPLLVFIALFVWIGAAQESAFTQMQSMLGGFTAADVMIPRVITLSPQDTLAGAVRQLLADNQQDFPVLRDGAVVGVLTRAGLLTALTADGEQALVGHVMDPDFQTAEERDALEVVLQKLQGRGCRTVPVLRRGALVGVITMENVGEFISVRTALGKHGG